VTRTSPSSQSLAFEQPAHCQDGRRRVARHVRNSRQRRRRANVNGVAEPRARVKRQRRTAIGIRVCPVITSPLARRTRACPPGRSRSARSPQDRLGGHHVRRRQLAEVPEVADVIRGERVEDDRRLVARVGKALVSEPTAYRDFPDLASLLEEALAGIELDPAGALAAGADPGDLVERVAYAAELLSKLVIKRQGAIRALISVSIARGTAPQVRPGYRFALIDQALAPLSSHNSIDAATLEQLRRDLAVVISAEAVLTLIDLYDLDSEATVASIVHTARLITEATLSRA
jgi:hypothetical protein